MLDLVAAGRPVARVATDMRSATKPSTTGAAKIWSIPGGCPGSTVLSWSSAAYFILEGLVRFPGTCTNTMCRGTGSPSTSNVVCAKSALR